MKCIIFILLCVLIIVLSQAIPFNQRLSEDSSSSTSEQDSSNESKKRHARSVLSYPSESSWSNNLDNTEYIRAMEIYKAKVVKRLNSSIILAHKPDVKRRLLENAVQKFKSCEAQSSHTCFATATGQTMALISGYEANHPIKHRDLINLGL